MNAYDSDESDGSRDPPMPVQQHSKPVVEGPKPKKKLDISFLPQEIQNALLHGDNGGDSDDDRDVSIPRKVQRTSHPNSSSFDDPLLRALPAPRNDFKDSTDPPVDIKSARKEAENGAPLAGAQETTNPVAPQGSHQPSTVPAFSNPFQIPSLAASMPSIPNQQESYFSANVGPQLEPDQQKNRKKRERELEQQLMSGDMSVLNEAHVVDVQAQNNWDSRHYMDNQVKEAMILKAYTGDTGSKSMLQPTKLQNRRHQLSSLALKAAETEIAMLEARGQRTKTKAQTQSKYGW